MRNKLDRLYAKELEARFERDYVKANDAVDRYLRKDKVENMLEILRETFNTLPEESKLKFADDIGELGLKVQDIYELNDIEIAIPLVYE